MAFASLSSGLLARKGQARPAMRPQGFDHGGPPPAAIEDLGWNDMGHDRTASAPPRLTPVAAEPEPVAPPEASAEPEAAAPDVQTPEPVEETAPQSPAVEPASVVALPVARAAAGTKGKAAFTLRLDPVRHLRLRLACALRHQSAQRVVTDALDAFLSGAELDHLAAEAAPHAKRS